jgi:hypothetical protein
MRAATLVVALLTGCTVVAPVDTGDPRFKACGATVESADATVAFTARDYHDHFPLMGISPELESDDQAFAVVFAEGEGPPMAVYPQIELGDHDEPPPPAQDSPHRTVCIYVGQPPDGVVNVYVGVDVALLLP